MNREDSGLVAAVADGDVTALGAALLELESEKLP